MSVARSRGHWALAGVLDGDRVTPLGVNQREKVPHCRRRRHPAPQPEVQRLTRNPHMTILVTMKRTRHAPSSIRAGEFKAKCLELMDHVANTGESIVITKRGKAVARLAPVVERPATLHGFMRDDIEVDGDIVAPLDFVWNALSD